MSIFCYQPDTFFDNHIAEKGICSICGKENCDVTMTNENEFVCDDCLDSCFFQCDECGEYWNEIFAESYILKDGRTICQNCAEEHDESEFETDE